MKQLLKKSSTMMNKTPFKIGLAVLALASLAGQAQPTPTYSWTNLPKIAQPVFRKDTLTILASWRKT